MASTGTKVVLLPEDEYPHEPDSAKNYNESMYLNTFDLQGGWGAWFRLGNRVNEGYAEMTICIYLPDGRVAFMYGRPQIETNAEMRAGGLHIEVVVPFEHLKVTYRGQVLLLDDPSEMEDPGAAFRNNERVECSVDLDFYGVSPMYGGKHVNADGSDIEADPERSFFKAHYEQHVRTIGQIRVGTEIFDMSGLGLRDKSWGPRFWQALHWYRWLPMVFSEEFALMLSIVGTDDPEAPTRQTGMVLVDGAYHLVSECGVESEWDERGYQTSMSAWARTESGKFFEVTGEVMSLIPLRNRRTTPDGQELQTRITEGMTRYRCGGRVGMGMSEYLDQIVDGRPVGPDFLGTASP